MELQGKKEVGSWWYLLVFAAYLLITLVFTWPLVLNFTTHVPGGGGDDQIFLWNLWWIKYAIVDLKTNPFYTDYLIYPFGAGLVVHVFVFLNGLLSIPLQYIFSLPTISNIFMVLSVSLSGFGTFLLSNRYVKDWRAVFLGGAVFAFCPVRMAHLTSHYNLIMTHWMPLYLLFMLKAFEDEEHALRNSLLAGVFLGATFLTEHYHFVFLGMFTALYIIYAAVLGKSRIAKLMRRTAVVGLSSAPFVLPILALLAVEIREGRVRKTLPLESGISTYVSDLLGFFSPSPENPILGWMSFNEIFTGNLPESTVYIGFVALFLVVIGWIKRKRDDESNVGFWVMSAIVFGVFSLGPYVHVLGKDTGVPMPYVVFDYLPILRNMRAPSRFDFALMLCVSVLCAFGARAVIRRRIVYSLIVLAILMEYNTVPLPLFDCSTPLVYRIISHDTEAQAVLDIPFSVRDGFNWVGLPATYIQTYQSVHRKKFFGGVVARLGPERALISYLNLPVLREIALIEGRFLIKKEIVEVDKRLAASVVDLFGIDYVVVHKDRNTGKMRLEVLVAHKFLKETLDMKKIYEDRWVVAYKTNRQRNDEVVVDAGEESSIPYLMWGWINGQSDGERSFAWSTGEKSTLLLNLDPAHGYEVRMRMKPHQGLPDRRVGVSLNREEIGSLSVSDGWMDYAIKLPGGSIKNGLNKLYLKCAASVPTDRDFGGIWSKGYSQYLKNLYLSGRNERKDDVLYWEHDNSKLKGSNVCVAMDWLAVRRIE